MVKVGFSSHLKISDISNKFSIHGLLTEKRTIYLSIIIFLTLSAMILGYWYVGALGKNHLNNELSAGNSNASESIITENAADNLVPSTSGEINTQLNTSTGNQSNSSSSESNQSSTTLTVNGQEIPIPKNGTVNRSIETNSGNVSVNVESHTSQSSTKDESSRSKSSSIEIESDSSSSVQSYNEEEVDIR